MKLGHNRMMTKYIIFIGLVLMGCSAGRPKFLGVHNNKLQQCPGSPNCVSSYSEVEREKIAPFKVNSVEDWNQLIEATKEVGGAVVEETKTDHYIHFEFTSTLLRFVDDLELLWDQPSGLANVRSASRVGRWDIGANRKRVESILQEYKARSESK